MVWPGAVVRAEDGAQAVYTRQDDGTYRRPAGVRSKLVRSGSGWKLTTPEHNTLTFDSTGKLASVLDARGHGLKLAYSQGLLSTITDAAGRVPPVPASGVSRGGGPAGADHRHQPLADRDREFEFPGADD